MKFEEGILRIESVKDFSEMNSVNKDEVTSVIVDKSVRTLKKGLFKMFENLKEVEIPEVKIIGEDAFYRCRQLERINMLKVDRIGKRALLGCGSLKKLDMPNLMSAGEATFRDCKQLEKVNVLKIEEIGKRTFFNCEGLEKLNMPNLKSIGEAAFRSCTQLKEINMPKLEKIGEIAFFDCENLEEAHIPEETYNKYKEEFKGTKVKGVSK